MNGSEVVVLRGVKEKGLEELKALRNRVARLYGMGRIKPESFEKINSRLLELEQLIQKEVEDDPQPVY